MRAARERDALSYRYRDATGASPRTFVRCGWGDTELHRHNLGAMHRWALEAAARAEAREAARATSRAASAAIERAAASSSRRLLRPSSLAVLLALAAAGGEPPGGR